jgi:hypothetical protein
MHAGLIESALVMHQALAINCGAKRRQLIALLGGDGPV